MKKVLFSLLLVVGCSTYALAETQINVPKGSNMECEPGYAYIAAQSSVTWSTSTATSNSYQTTIQNNGTGYIRYKIGTATNLLQGIRLAAGQTKIEDFISGDIYVQTEAGVTPGEVVIERAYKK